MRRHSICAAMVVLAGAVALAPASAASAGEALAATSGSDTEFTVFCASWMDKLAERERNNQHHVKWQPSQDGVDGQYVGYSQRHTCQTKLSRGVPIGLVVYYEFRYRKHGPSIDTAAASPPEVIETTEVTEIFRYAAGKWVY